MPRKAALLERSSLFSDLSSSDLDTIASYCRYRKFEEGEVVFSEGSHGEELFIIQKGEVLITKHRDEHDIDIARFITGETFGELELLDEAPRTTSATAVQPTLLLQFPAGGHQFRNLLQRHAPLLAPVLHKLLAMIAERIRSTNRLISENAPWVQGLRRQLHSDKLTGLHNRTYLEEDFGELLPSQGEGTALVMVKPDRFKHINDRFGHEAGDRVLRALAHLLNAEIGGDGIVARYRGDEFAVILPAAGLEQARARAASLAGSVHALDLHDVIGAPAEPITVSIGIALYPRDGQNHLDLIQSGFELMFRARERGGNRVLSTGDRVEAS
jgi:diguanylate cyclase (GGDEF)-like protein